MKLLLLLFLITTAGRRAVSSSSAPSGQADTAGAVREVVAVVGEDVRLPCPALPSPASHSQDFPVSFLVYRSLPRRVAIYRLHLSGQKKTHLAVSHYSSRAYLRLSPETNAWFELDSVTEEDVGEYECDLDYAETKLVNKSRLVVMQDPFTPIPLVGQWSGRLLVMTGGGRDVSGGGLLPAVPEHSSLTLFCSLDPATSDISVRWRMDLELRVVAKNISPGQITLGPLTRKMLHGNVTCSAAGQHVNLTIDITYGASSVWMEGVEAGKVTVRAGMMQQVVCSARGSHPPAHLTWHLNHQPLSSSMNLHSLFNQTANVVVSKIKWIPRPEQHMSQLSCSSHTPGLQLAPISTTVTLNILYEPQVEAKWSSRFQPGSVNEGGTLTLSCQVTANPPPDTIYWSRNDKVLNFGGRVLLLSEVSAAHTGDYRCTATNSQGTNTSNPITLRVHTRPVCEKPEPRKVEAAPHSELNLTCPMHASPVPHLFKWKVADQSTTVQSSPFFVYTPPSTLARDTVLQCWAANAMGSQLEPCVIFISPPAPPEPVKSCQARQVTSNQTYFTPSGKTGSTSTITDMEHPTDPVPDALTTEIPLPGGMKPVSLVSVECEGGGGRGNETLYFLNVTDHLLPDILEQQPPQQKPEFTVSRMVPGHNYTLTVTVVQANVSSPPYSFLFSLPYQHDHASRSTNSSFPSSTASPSSNGPSSVAVKWVLGVVAVAVVIPLVILVIRAFTAHQQGLPRPHQQPPLMTLEKIIPPSSDPPMGVTGSRESYNDNGPSSLLAPIAQTDSASDVSNVHGASFSPSLHDDSDEDGAEA